MHALYVVSVWVHLLAAITWVGGIAFLTLVVVPWMRMGNRQQGAVLLRDTGTRFRTVGWVCFGVVLVTGTFNLFVRGVRLRDFVDPVWVQSEVGSAVLLKLCLFVAVLLLSSLHDFVIGPRATRLLAQQPVPASAEQARRTASLMGRVTALLALGLVFAGVVIVRGWP